MTSVVIADDHGFFRKGVEVALEIEGFTVVGAVGDGEGALAATRQTNPDILILDIRMPELGGIATLQQLRANGNATPVIILAIEIDDKDLISALDAGANAILLKNRSETRLFDAIRAVSDGIRFIDGHLLDRAIALFKGHACSFDLGVLTDREEVVARKVAQGKSNRDIASELDVTEGTVKVFLSKIFAKLGISNRTELALMVQGS